MARTFIDTNVLVYCIDKREAAKRETAKEVVAGLLRSSEAIISTQIVQETYVSAVKKVRIDATQAKRWIGYLERFELILVDFELVNSAIDYRILHMLSFWDALIVASAERSSCDVLLTEDLSHGQMIRGVRVVNPFVSG